mgnify:FL=1
MDKLKKAFGHSDPLGQMAIDTQAYLDAMKMHQQNMTANAYNNPHTDAFLLGVIANTKVKVRNHIANEVEKMAEEIGAPTLLHAVVLAIRTMEIPE